ncbi:MAG: hypothetical protein H7331_02815 [Bacteroidia bacterium]|nr:hypothetical protein [Bacteroidia bacterium]
MTLILRLRSVTSLTLARANKFNNKLWNTCGNGAELSKPLQNSSFEFKFYNVVPADKIRTQPPTMPVQQQKTLPAGTLIAQYGKYAFIPYS